MQLMRHAERIATNRTVAESHFPADSVAGMVLALSLSEFFLARFAGSKDVRSRSFDGRQFDEDFTYEAVLARRYERRPHSGEKPIDGEVITECPTSNAIPRSDLLNHLWNEALAEWRLTGSKAQEA